MSQVDSEQLHLPRILVVDDSRIVRATIKKHLATSYDVVEAANGEEGWQQLLADETIQLLISDLSMPELDGLGLLARARSAGDGRLYLLPVIIISGEEDDAIKQKCVECGATDFISKSTDRTELLARVAANIHLAAMQHELAIVRTEQAQVASRDHSTGVASSHLLMLQMEQSMAYAMRHNSEVTLLLLEIDHYQPLKQKLGDRLADQMLSLLAKLLAAKLRREDTLAHVEGPQFAIVAPGTSLSEVRVMAERLRQCVSAARINFRDERLEVSASVAVANSWHDDTHLAPALFSKAITRLYGSSGEGRILMPDENVNRLPLLPLSDALLMLHKGHKEEVRPHLPALLAGLAPLIHLANEEYGLDWSLDFLQQGEAVSDQA
ncbi:diguanylate cyclase [Iodobacter sp. HSC-16F04]|uniref:Diguanylate cyclase n=1 Tax=Iodobacter violaceini TaxID=3044271 RepID=A0ABX0KW49_9NEIS|nr:diguanylate cyclase [Iodobacter violacea]NHQ88014.1 diguanylate cyclase [Iodobacter violacea]